MAVLPGLTQCQANWLPFPGTLTSTPEMSPGECYLWGCLPPLSLLLASFLSLSLHTHLVSTYYVSGIPLDTEVDQRDEALVLRE